MADTPARLLRLLSLLQTPREWPGPELAERLEVSERTVRNDVDRLRRLGYPVEATRGRVGGYRLAAGQAMPPLLLDDAEAVAVAVALRTATGGGVEGLEESSLQALTKLHQVLPKRLRRQVDVFQAAMVARRRPAHPSAPSVTADLLTTVAEAAHGREVLRFAYAAYDGTASERRVEPYRLVNLGRRWYLVAFDPERADWRTFRLDRMSEARSVGHRFKARDLPADDLGEWVAGKTRQVMLKVDGVVEFDAPADEVERRMGPWVVGTVEVLAPDRCRVGIGGRKVDEIAVWLGLLDVDFRVVDSPDLADAVRRVAGRYARAAG